MSKWKEYSLSYCLKVCASGRMLKGTRGALHDGAQIVLDYIERYRAKYGQFPSRKKVASKFKLDMDKLWDRSYTLASLRDEIVRERAKDKIMDMQLKLQEMLVDSPTDYSLGDYMLPLTETMNELMKTDTRQVIRLTKSMKIVNKFMRAENNERVAKYGFPLLDKSTGGISKRDYIVLWANTSEGKSTMARAIASNIALQGKRVLYITLEEGGSKSVVKTVALGAQGSATDVFDQKLSRDDELRFRKYIRKVRKMGGDIIFLDDMETRTVAELHQLVQVYKPDVIIIDQLSHLIPASSAYKTNKAMYEHIHYISKSLQAFIQRESIPIIALHQSNRHSKSGDKDEMGMGYGPQQDCDVSIYLCPSEKSDDGVIWKRARLTKCRDRECNITIDYYWKLARGIVREQMRSLEDAPQPVEIMNEREEYAN
jgi:KaiC/GvpD/RAD55 family RecA-like ATPase